MLQVQSQSQQVLFTKTNFLTMDIFKEKENLSGKLKYLLMFGKIIGALPSGTVLDRLIGAIPVILLVVACVDLIGISLLNPKQGRTATELAGDFGVPWFYGLGTFLYFYMQRNVHQLLKILQKWDELYFQNVDRKLKCFANTSSFLVLSSAILENAVFHFKLFPVLDEEQPIANNKSSLEVFYERSHGHWAFYVPYSPVIAVFLLITNKWALYVWNFADVLCAILCRALHFRFSNLITASDPEREEEQEESDFDPAITTPVVKWDFLWKEYRFMTDLVHLTENFLSPIIFGCYGLNLYAICMQLHMWLAPSDGQHLVHTLYNAWSFVHLLARVLLLSVNAAKVHEEIKRVEIYMQNCLDEKFSAEIERLDYGTNAAKRGPGLSGLGCFLLTKPFILTIFSVAFTFEIFLLQSDTINIG